MSEFLIQKLPYVLSSQAGLALVGKYLRHINLNVLVNPAFPVRSGAAEVLHVLGCVMAANRWS